MSLLEELHETLASLPVPIETGIFSNQAPDRYLVLVSMSDNFDLHADNEPQMDVQEVRLSLYSKDSYTALKNQLVRILLAAGFTISDRRYINFESDTGYHHYNVDVAKQYTYETEE